MPKEVSIAANAVGVWLVAVIVVSVVAVQAILYIRLALATARKIGFARDKCVRALRSGVISAVGPSVAILIVMVAMMSVVGAPITWLRLSIIGAAPTELTAAKVGSEATGVEFGSAQYDMKALAGSWWAMGINGVGWLVLVGLFAHRLETIREKVGGGDARWLALLSGAATLGAFAFLNVNNIFPLDQVEKVRKLARGTLVASLVGAVVMVILLTVSRRLPWLKEYALGLAMLAGMAAAMLARMAGMPN
jgi:hypothetical protein